MADAKKMSATTSTSGCGGKRRFYSFVEARRMARTYGFTSQEEFLDYDCPGTYQVPKDPQVVWADEWKGWDDFLGVPLAYEQGKQVARELAERMHLTTKEDYLAVMEKRGGTTDQSPISDDDLAARLPYRPDLYYENEEWESWEEWLGGSN